MNGDTPINQVTPTEMALYLNGYFGLCHRLPVLLCHARGYTVVCLDEEVNEFPPGLHGYADAVNYLLMCLRKNEYHNRASLDAVFSVLSES
jgi:hypothetical protein